MAQLGGEVESARAVESGASNDSDEYDSDSSSAFSDDDEEPVLKYKRFAKDVILSTCEGPNGGGRNVISCITVHPKVRDCIRKYMYNTMS